MATGSPERLRPDHSVTVQDGVFRILLNKPDDFVYDISNVTLVYDQTTETVAIVCPEMPEHIANNMLAFSRMPIVDYVHFLETELNTFCAGQIPDIERSMAHGEYSRASASSEKKKPAEITGREEGVRPAQRYDNPPDDEIPGQQPSRPGELSRSYRFPVGRDVSPNIKYDIDRTNILLFACQVLNLTVECDRCKRIVTSPSAVDCPKCSTSLSILFIPTVESEYLGFLSLKRCSLVAFNPTQYQFSCIKCNGCYETPLLGIGQSFATTCYDCFTDLRIRIQGLLYLPKKDYVLKRGSELPGRGTCKHYKKSYRWFRFSCCGSLYPCDICHNEDTSHGAEEAKTMVCGLCSKEQSVKKECDCGMTMKTVHKQFWEGGKGNRERSTMSRNDPRKYKGS